MREIDRFYPKAFLDRYGVDLAEALGREAEARARLLEALAGLEPERFAAPREGGGWSPAEIAEHLSLADRGFAAAIAAAAHGRRPYEQRRGRLGPTGRPVAPDEATPTGRLADGDAAERALRESGEALRAAVARAEAAGTLGTPCLGHAFFGPLTPLELVRLTTWHLNHHRRQLPPATGAGAAPPS